MRISGQTERFRSSVFKISYDVKPYFEFCLVCFCLCSGAEDICWGGLQTAVLRSFFILNQCEHHKKGKKDAVLLEPL